MNDLVTKVGALWKRKPQKVAVLGSDCCGKTTLLYRLKLDGVVSPIPTIGFNIETINRNKREYELWDVGGCDQIKPLWRHYIDPSVITLYLHDPTDTTDWRQADSIESVHLLAHIIMEAGAKFLFVAFPKQDMLPADKASQMIKECSEIYDRELQKYNGKLIWKILDVPYFSSWTSEMETLLTIFDQMQETMTSKQTIDPKVASSGELPKEIEEEPKKESKEESKAEIRRPTLDRPSDEELQKRITQEAVGEASAEVFWQQFLSAELPAWNHRCHLRAGYFVLLDTLQRGFGTFQAMETFLEHLKRLKAAQPDRFRNTEHVTMTCFWFHYLQGGIITFRNNSKTGDWPSQDDFHELLVQSPHLMFTGLWRQHYTQDRIMNVMAKEAWRLPDLVGLPHFTLSSKQEFAKTEQEEGEDQFRLVHFAFDTVQSYLNSSLTRGQVVKLALLALQSSTMQQRAKRATIPPYSETQAYFWIQYVHAALASAQGMQDPWGEKSETFSNLSYESFRVLFEIQPNAWKMYYSTKVWDSLQARTEFVLPDLKPLPNVIRSPSMNAKMAAFRKQLQQSLLSELKLPSPEYLLLHARLILEKTKDREDLEPSQVIDHATFLLFAYENIVANRPGSEGTLANHASSVITAQYTSYAMSFTQKAFWVQQFLAVIVQSIGGDTNNTGMTPSFDQFLMSNPQLALEELSATYYSPEVWNSLDAKETFVAPDRRSLPGFVKSRSK